MTDAIKNFAIGTLTGPYTSTDVSIDLVSGQGVKFPAITEGNYNLVWWNATDYSNPADDPDVEVVRVVNKSTDTFTIIRGQEGTTATNKNVGGRTYKVILAYTKQEADKSASNHGDYSNRRTLLGSLDNWSSNITSRGRQTAVFDGATSVFDSSFDGTGTLEVYPDATVMSGTSTGIGFTLSSDGSKAFAQTGQKVYEYALATKWDITTATPTQNQSLPASLSNYDYTGIKFSNDGLKLFVSHKGTAFNPDMIREITLSAPFSLTGGLSTYTDHNVTSPPNYHEAFCFSQDGIHLYEAHSVTNGNNHSLTHYILSTPFDVASRKEISTTVLTDSTRTITDMSIHPDGMTIFIHRIPADNSIVHRYRLPKQYDTSTLTFDSGFSFGTNRASCIHIPQNGLYIYRYRDDGTVHKRSLYSNNAIIMSPAGLSAKSIQLRGAVSSGDAVLGIDGSGNFVTKNAFLQNGNSFGTETYLGTNDNYNLVFKANGLNRAILYPNGNFQVGYRIAIGTNYMNGPQRLVVSDVGNVVQTPWTDSIAAFIGNSSRNHILFQTYETGAGLIFKRTNGSPVSPTEVTSGNMLGQLTYSGRPGVTDVLSSSIRSYSTENWSPTASGSDLRFYTTAPTTTGMSESMRLWDSGDLQVGLTYASANRGKITAQDTVRDANAGVGSPVNYMIYLQRAVNSNGTGPGIAFASTTDSTNVGASIIHTRTSSNSLGHLDFYLKNTTTAAAAPVQTMRLHADGSLTLGSGITSYDTTGIARLRVVGTNVTESMMTIERISTDTFGGSLRFKKARGTIATPTAVLSGDTLFTVGGTGHDGTSYTAAPSAYIVGAATENQTPTTKGSFLAIYTTPNGSTTSKVVAQFGQDGNFMRNVTQVYKTTDFTLDATYNNYLVKCDSASAMTLTILDDATQPVTVGRVYQFVQMGAGAVSVVGDVGVTINTPASLTIERYQIYTLINIAPDEWLITKGVM